MPVLDKTQSIQMLKKKDSGMDRSYIPKTYERQNRTDLKLDLSPLPHPLPPPSRHTVERRNQVWLRCVDEELKGFRGKGIELGGGGGGHAKKTSTLEEHCYGPMFPKELRDVSQVTPELRSL